MISSPCIGLGFFLKTSGCSVLKQFYFRYSSPILDICKNDTLIIMVVIWIRKNSRSFAPAVLPDLPVTMC